MFVRPLTALTFSHHFSLAVSSSVVPVSSNHLIT